MIIFEIIPFAKASKESMERTRHDIENQIKTHPHFVVVPPTVRVKYYPETGPAEIVIRKEHEDDK